MKIVIDMNGMPDCCVECHLNLNQIWDGTETNFCMAKQENVGNPYNRPNWCPLKEVEE